MCMTIVCYPGSDVMDFEIIILIFLIEMFLLHDQNVMTKT